MTSVRDLTNTPEFRRGKPIRFRCGKITYEIAAKQNSVIMRRNRMRRGSAGEWSPWHLGVIAIEDLDAVGVIPQRAARKSWVITAFDHDTLTGTVSHTRRKQSFPFHSTSFSSNTTLRFPRKGEKVEVVLRDFGGLLSVHGD